MSYFYLRALRTLSDLEIIYGSFLSHDVMMPVAEPASGGPRFAKVTRHTPSQVLTKHAYFIKQIREGVLRSSQFPQTLQDADGEFRRPRDW